MVRIAGYLTSRFDGDLSSALHGMADALLIVAPAMRVLETATPDGRFVSGWRSAVFPSSDLSTGHQPLGNEDGSDPELIQRRVYNFQELRGRARGQGASFCHAFRHGNIVHAYEEWGERACSASVACFAFAIWDCAGGSACSWRVTRYGKKRCSCRRQNGTLLLPPRSSPYGFPGVKPEVITARCGNTLPTVMCMRPPRCFAASAS